MNGLRYFLTLILFFSCQSSRKQITSSQREIASIVETENEVLISEVIETIINKKSKELVPLSFSVIDQIKIKKADSLECSNYKSRYEDQEYIYYKLSDPSSLVCKSDKDQKVIIEYQVLKSRFERSYFWPEVRDYLINKVKNNKYDSLISELDSIGISILFESRLHYNQVKNLTLDIGDYFSAEYKSFESILISCKGDECTHTNGRKVIGASNNNKSFLRYQFLPPFLLFCGPRYPAAEIWFRADEDFYFDRIIDSRGISCDLNKELSSNKKFDFYFKAFILRKETIESYLPLSIEKLSENLQDKKIQRFFEDIKLIKVKVNEEISTGLKLLDVSDKKRPIKLDQHKVEYFVEPYFQKCQYQCDGSSYFISNIKEIYYDKFGHSYEKSMKKHTHSFMLKLEVPKDYGALKLSICAKNKQQFESELNYLSRKKKISNEEFKNLLSKFLQVDCNSDEVLFFKESDFKIKDNIYSLIYKTDYNSSSNRVSEATILEFKKFLGNNKYLELSQDSLLIEGIPFRSQDGLGLPRILEKTAPQNEIMNFIEKK